MTGGAVSGAAPRAYVGGLWSALPDLTFAAESIGAIGPDLIAGLWGMRGTNTGSMRGLPPTGRAAPLRGIDLIRLRDRKIMSVKG